MFLEPLQNDEIKESLNQTSNKNTFEIFDTKPSTSANNDPSDPPKKKKNRQWWYHNSKLFTSTFIYKFIQKKSIMYFNKYSLV